MNRPNAPEIYRVSVISFRVNLTRSPSLVYPLQE